MAGEALAQGRALAKFREWIAAQGGDPRIADDASLLPSSARTREVRATTAGWVARFDAEEVGRAAMVLGAGRAHVGDSIDPSAGLVLAVRVGDRVEEGSAVCTLYAASEESLDLGEERFRRALHLTDREVILPPLFHEL